ncbi:carboxyvinyl-carboxyphosphonate phosphorylmutase [Bacillus cereus VD133]|uniref:Carboxyvinyl-carboxyphosphonate phosphorylmutase n=1 Tax=Bacillus cereus VD133 TaxID=1053233 RepID=A0A9W5PKV0_BACCE|nr:isocitrate lyase/PEP mutase family protein [Bacillus cereus]EOO25574.1 carboxyvinyl-carboxyphosphonate phosphorylmutase [Bacillus cereus VD133]
MSKKISLKQLLQKEGIIVAPGCHDALGARLIESVGFDAVYMTGNGVSASALGKPDIGLLTMSEMITRARGIVSAVDVPVIADADTGYGNLNNVIRTVQEYEAIGVSAIHLEDQVTPKKCGAMSGIELISIEEHADKIRAAIGARRNEDFLVIGRTDARSTKGLNEAIERGRAYAKAGADLVILEMLESVDELKEVARKIDAPLMFSFVEHTRIPNLTVQKLESIGYKLVIYPLSSTLLYAKATIDLMKSLKETGTTENFQKNMLRICDYEGFLGIEKYK